MEVLLDFLFQLFKIAILASIYSFLLILIISIIKILKPSEFLKKITVEKKKYWFAFGFIISIVLLFFSFTYWGNHGLGDGPKIPIGYWKTIENTNWDEYGYLNEPKTNAGINIETTKFKVENSILCGNLDSSFYVFQNSYFVLDLKTEVLAEFRTENHFNEYAQNNDLPTSNELLSFSENYKNHWGGIRFFLLP